MNKTIRTGTCSWTDKTLVDSGWYPASIKRDAAARLRYYSERFTLVENDAAYYAIPDPKQAALWVERTPAGFTMNVKAFAPLTTHFTDPQRLPKEIRDALPPEVAAKRRVYPKDLGESVVDELFARFWVALEPLRKSGKLGAILLQYPDWFTISGANKEQILRARDRLPDDRLAIEFRNGLWMEERNRRETLAFLREHGLTYVAVDEPQGFRSSVPPVSEVTAPLAMVRFHGRNAETWEKPGITAAERFDYRYSTDELKEWVQPLRHLAEEADEVHALMNNCYADHAVRNALELAQLLS